MNWKSGLLAGMSAIALGLSAKSCYDADRRAEGAAEEQIKVVSVQRDSLKTVRDSLANAQRAQKETLRVTLIKRIPVHDTVTRWFPDTVPVPVEIVREVVRVDSVVIAACMLTLTTCERRVSILETDLSLSQQQTAFWKHRAQPSTLLKIRNALPWIVLLNLGVRAFVK